MRKDIKEITCYYKIVYQDNTIKKHNFKITGFMFKKLHVIYNGVVSLSTITEIKNKLGKILQNISWH